MTTHQFTQSERATWLRCRRKWWFAYHRRLRRRGITPKLALDVGNLVHDVLADGYASGWELDVDSTLFYHGEALKELIGESPEVDEAITYAGIIVQGYLDWVSETGADAALEVVAPERVIEVPIEIADGWRRTTLLGKVDLTARRLDMGGALTFLDHKVVGDLTSFPKWAHLSPQMLFYHLLHRLEAPDEPRVEAGTYNLLRRVKRTARANPPFYARLDVHHSPEQLRTFYSTTLAIFAEIENTSALLLQGWSDVVLCPPSPQEDCYWSCEFFAACAMRDEGKDADLEGYLEDVYVEGDPLERYRNGGTDA